MNAIDHAYVEGQILFQLRNFLKGANEAQLEILNEILFEFENRGLAGDTEANRFITAITDVLAESASEDVNAPDWLESDLGLGTTFELTVFEESGRSIEEITTSRAEYFALKVHLAHLRGNVRRDTDTHPKAEEPTPKVEPTELSAADLEALQAVGGHARAMMETFPKLVAILDAVGVVAAKVSAHPPAA